MICKVLALLTGGSLIPWRHWVTTLIARYMGPTWGPSGADRTQVSPMMDPWTLLSGWLFHSSIFVHCCWSGMLFYCRVVWEHWLPDHIYFIDSGKLHCKHCSELSQPTHHSPEKREYIYCGEIFYNYLHILTMEIRSALLHHHINSQCYL